MDKGERSASALGPPYSSHFGRAAFTRIDPQCFHPPVESASRDPEQARREGPLPVCPLQGSKDFPFFDPGKDFVERLAGGNMLCERILHFRVSPKLGCSWVFVHSLAPLRRFQTLLFG